jgi:hypothetical protein
LEFDIGGTSLRTTSVLDIEERDATGTMPRPVSRHAQYTARVTR